MNQADTAWMLIATALVLLMTPALAFFYGGLVRSKNALNTMMMSFISLGFVGVLWAVIGYSLAFAPGNNWIGDTSRVFLNGVGLSEQGTIPHLLFMCFQGTFAIITAALISGAIVERMRFSAYVVFICLWALLVYSPLCHWVWGGGWLADMGALDFAGGTVVHVNAGAAALVAAICVGKRKDYPGRAFCRTTCRSRSSARACSGSAGSGSTPAARSRPTGSRPWRSRPRCSRPPGTLVVWTILDLDPAAEVDRGRRRDGDRRRPGRHHSRGRLRRADERHRPRRDCRDSQLLRAVIRAKTSLDDSLDVVAAHGVGGTVGAILTGVFAQKGLNGIADGLLFGNPGQVVDPDCRRRRGHRLQRRHELRAAEAHRTGAAAARRFGRRDRRPRRHAARRGGVHPRAWHDPAVDRFPAERCAPGSYASSPVSVS